MPLAPLVQIEPVPVDLEVDELVVVPLRGLTLRNTMTTIEGSQTMMLLSRSQITMKHASTFYRLKSPIQKKLPMTY